MSFWRTLFYAVAAGRIIGRALGIYCRRARERREAQDRQAPPVIAPRRYPPGARWKRERAWRR